MSKNTGKAKEIKAVPFFARFLEEQAAQNETAPYVTKKYPSDWEEY
ncbi:microviridin/marinostatin family tricyclic proteinase inhibitor [Gloeothece verrucosa]|uniref:Microviridin/marinostatin family tricyclic proteinase inhibitor n=1 Tax=Gloeothece verrucosa (strain PCC 7822) TaxID=497965 RepID=E0UGC8_GLOV7|nr:microviridin/marinostatin family tricyclic proteinase inhibitor [Gloeothece verrucosa]ADN16747.1 hypothetical protein Cyan7822_4856 [Gloeothece verrucosa PCC 7822]ADN16748.1 hypothetical protein Cyan7822_4857 [Gloeothece verrucosa PCC 7822]